MTDTPYIEVTLFPMVSGEEGDTLWDRHLQDKPDYFDVLVIKSCFPEPNEILEEYEGLTEMDAYLTLADMLDKYPGSLREDLFHG
jgi:hypothetical protein